MNASPILDKRFHANFDALERYYQREGALDENSSDPIDDLILAHLQSSFNAAYGIQVSEAWIRAGLKEAEPTVEIEVTLVEANKLVDIVNSTSTSEITDPSSLQRLPSWLVPKGAWRATALTACRSKWATLKGVCLSLFVRRHGH